MTLATPAQTIKTGGPCVYFVQGAGGGPIKIGVAMDLTSRLKGLQYTSPVPLVCLAWTPGYIELEQTLHDRFVRDRLHGEWFKPSRALRAFIDSLNCEKQDVDRPNRGKEYRRASAEYSTLKEKLKQAQRELDHIRDVRRRTRWRICGLDPSTWAVDPASDLFDEGEVAERLIETENEVRLTLFWDDGERKFAIRALEGDAEFTDKAWERIVEAAMVYADNLNASLHAADVVW